jgi:hypothetical protein
MASAEATLHQTSLAVWDIPPAVAAGERYSVKLGAKSSAGCALGGCRAEVRDEAGTVLGYGRLGDVPWPETSGLYWAEIELIAPQQPGPVTLLTRLELAELEEPHDGASAPFSVSVVARAEHLLTVTVVSGGRPVDEAYIRLGPYRATTDAAGVARVRLARGDYELVVWKAGYDTAPVRLAIAADTAVQVDARAMPQDDPDAVWTA